MNFEVSGERQELGIRGFNSVYYKYELKKGSLRKTLIFFGISIVVLILLRIFVKEVKGIVNYALIFILCFTVFFAVLIIGTSFLNKRKKISSNIEKVNYSFENKIVITVYFKNGSTEKSEYQYTDVIKAIEEKDFFYFFIQSTLAFPVDKQSIEDVEKFKNIIINNGIFLGVL